MNPRSEALLGLTPDYMSLPHIRGSGLHTCFITRLHLRLTLLHTLTQHSTSTSLPELERHCFIPSKGHYSGAFWELIRLPCYLLKQDWIWTQVLTNLMSGAPRLVPEPFQVSLCNWNLPPWLAGIEATSPRSTQSGGTWQGQPSQWAGDIEPVTRRWNTTFQIPGRPPEMLQEGSDRDWKKSFQEAGLLSKLAATQRTHVQRLSTKNKGFFSYIPFRACYRNGGVGYILSHT
jgi:hypothetical protein